MNTIGICILLAVVIFVLDRNQVWPQVWRGTKRALKVTAKVAAILTVVVLVGWGIIIAIDAHNTRVAERAATAQAAAETQATIEANKSACQQWEISHPVGSGIDWAGPKGNGEIIYPPVGCEGPLENEYQTKVTNTLSAEIDRINAAKHRPSTPT